MTMQNGDTDETTALARLARKRNPEDTRRRILDAAERAFALRGYAGARLRDIAQEAGVHHALVHHYYGDKLGLFQQVLERGLGRITGVGLEALADPPRLDVTVRAFVSVLFDFCAHNRSLLRTIESAFRDRESVSFELTQNVMGQMTGPLVSRLIERLREGQALNVVRSDLPVETLVLMGLGAIVYRFITTEELMGAMGLSRALHSLDEEREHAVQYVLSTLRPR